MKKMILSVVAFVIILSLSVMLLSCGENQKAPAETTGTIITTETPTEDTEKGTDKTPETTVPVITDPATTEPMPENGMSPAEDTNGSAWGEWIPAEKPTP